MQRVSFATGIALVLVVMFSTAPTPATARPFLSQPTGTLLATGTALIGTNIGSFVMTTSQGNVTCSQVVLGGSLKRNNTAEGAEINITSGSAADTGSTECPGWTGGITVNLNPLTNGFPWCIKATGTTDTIALSGGSCGTSRAIRLTFAFTNALIGTCTYQRTEAASGTLVTDGAGESENSVRLTKQFWGKFEGGSGCPSSTEFDWTFSFETEAASPVFLSS